MEVYSSMEDSDDDLEVEWKVKRLKFEQPKMTFVPEKMKFSLFEMTLRKIVTNLWSSSDVLYNISKLPYNICEMGVSSKHCLDVLEHKIKDNVLRLHLPDLITPKLFQIIRPIGLEIKTWRDVQEYNLRNQVPEMDLSKSAEICWTMAGKLDWRKTAEAFVRCDAIDVDLRYKLACVNCLEGDIELLWEELPDEKKSYFYVKALHQINLSTYLPFCWPHILKGELSNLEYLTCRSHLKYSVFQWLFEHSAKSGNKMATEYFFHKCAQERRLPLLARAVYRIMSENLENLKTGFADVFYYLLSEMNPKQQKEAYNLNPYLILFRFLEWPWPDLRHDDKRDEFLALFSVLWKKSFLNYNNLLEVMYNRFQNSDPYFVKLFPDFFKESPFGFQKYFINQESVAGEKMCRFLALFLMHEDSESCIKVVFRNVEPSVRERLLFNQRVLLCFEKLLSEKKPYKIKLCLRETSLHREQRLQAEKCFESALRVSQSEDSEAKLKMFLELFDETCVDEDVVKKGEKRKLEE